MSDQTHEQEREIKAKVAAELREATVAEASAEELPDENTVSKAAVYLNTKLPKTRTIAQALVRDEAGGVMLCELSYKRFWDLLGGVVDQSCAGGLIEFPGAGHTAMLLVRPGSSPWKTPQGLRFRGAHRLRRIRWSTHHTTSTRTATATTREKVPA